MLLCISSYNFSKTSSQYYICDVLRDLVPTAQFKRHEKHPWGSVTFSKVAGSACFCGCFFVRLQILVQLFL